MSISCWIDNGLRIQFVYNLLSLWASLQSCLYFVQSSVTAHYAALAVDPYSAFQVGWKWMLKLVTKPQSCDLDSTLWFSGESHFNI